MKITSLTLLFSLIIITSCMDDYVMKIPDESPHQQLVDDYLSEIRIVPAEHASKLMELKAAINYRDAVVTKMSDNEDVLVADVVDYKLHGPDKVTALFFIQDGVIVRSSLVSMSASVPNQRGAIASILRSRFDSKGFSGRVGFYNVFGEILFYNSATNGRIDESGMIKPRKGRSTGGRVNACTDWYLVTTYYYSSGASYKTEAYMYTTCDGVCQGTRIGGRIKCGEGGGGTYTDTPSFPPSPTDGDMREWTDKDGVTRVYIFSAVSNMWLQVSMTLGNVVIQANPTTYSFLLFESPPPDKSIVTDAADVWVYDAWGGKWTGDDDYPEVDVEPERIIRNRGAHFDCFSTSSGAALTIYADQPVANTRLATQGRNAGHVFITIDQVIDGVHHIRTVGFYPETGATPVSPEDVGVLANDQGAAYDVSLTVDISAAELTALLNYLTGALPAYHLNNSNCVNVAVGACGAASVALPENISNWILGSGLSPGRMGEDLRTWDVPGRGEVHDNDGGTAPTDNCP